MSNIRLAIVAVSMMISPAIGQSFHPYGGCPIGTISKSSGNDDVLRCDPIFIVPDNISGSGAITSDAGIPKCREGFVLLTFPGTITPICARDLEGPR